MCRAVTNALGISLRSGNSSSNLCVRPLTLEGMVDFIRNKLCGKIVFDIHSGSWVMAFQAKDPSLQGDTYAHLCPDFCFERKWCSRVLACSCAKISAILWQIYSSYCVVCFSCTKQIIGEKTNCSCSLPWSSRGSAQPHPSCSNKRFLTTSEPASKNTRCALVWIPMLPFLPSVAEQPWAFPLTSQLWLSTEVHLPKGQGGQCIPWVLEQEIVPSDACCVPLWKVRGGVQGRGFKERMLVMSPYQMAAVDRLSLLSFCGVEEPLRHTPP